MHNNPTTYPNLATPFQYQYPKLPYSPSPLLNTYSAQRRVYYPQLAQPTRQYQNSWRQPLALTGDSIPDSETVKNKLTTGRGMQVGLKYGAMAGLLGALPIWGMEHWVKEPNLIQLFTQMYEQVKRPNNMKWTQKLVQYSLAPSLMSTVLIGGFTGTMLGGWIVSQTRKKLLTLNEVKEAQQQGRFVPKTPTRMQEMGLASMPIDNPQAAFREMLQKDLNDQQSFWHGAKIVMMAKVLPGVIGLGLNFVLLFAMRKFYGKDEVSQAVMKMFDPLMKLPFQPVLIAKLCAFPLLGGLIAKQTVPWMKEQLGIQGS